MIKSLPCRCAQEDVLEAIHALGFADDYDFFYMPMRPPFTKPQNYGYAFINFINEEKSLAFQNRLAESEVPIRRSSIVYKKLSVAPAHLQGADSHAEHFKGTSVVRTTWGPKMKDDALDDCKNG